MRYLCIFFLTFVSSILLFGETVCFNWSNPSSLTPSFVAPTSANRYGPYINGAVFTTPEGVTFDIDDSGVKELSQKARFIYGYLTDEVELRVYPGSTFTITAPDGKAIKSISFTGAKADDIYMGYTGEGGVFKGNNWTAKDDNQVAVTFSVETTINCTSTSVNIGIADGVEVIKTDRGEIEWFGIDGSKLRDKPERPGIYIIKRDNLTMKVLVR